MKKGPNNDGNDRYVKPDIKWNLPDFLLDSYLIPILSKITKLVLIYTAKVLISVIDLRSVTDFRLGRPRKDCQIIKFTSSVYSEKNWYFTKIEWVLRLIVIYNTHGKVWIILNFEHLVDK